MAPPNPPAPGQQPAQDFWAAYGHLQAELSAQLKQFREDFLERLEQALGDHRQRAERSEREVDELKKQVKDLQLVTAKIPLEATVSSYKLLAAVALGAVSTLISVAALLLQMKGS